MITATLQEAKATLNELVEKALAGEQVVLKRGAHMVVTLMPISEKDIELSIPQLTDSQAERYWSRVGQEKSKSFSSIDEAALFLKKNFSPKSKKSKK